MSELEAAAAAEPAAIQPPPRFRRAKQIIAGLAVFATCVCFGMVVTAAVGDFRIGRDPAYATADVVNVGVLRTTVRFPDELGAYHQPERGLMYSVGLENGQQVRVQYQKSDPRNVKVRGRSWTLAWRPALSSFAVVVVVIALLWGIASWRTNRWLRKYQNRASK